MSAPGVEIGHVVWFAHPSESWVVGVVKDIDNRKDLYTVQPQDKNLKRASIKGHDVYRYQESDTQNADLEHDLLNLMELHESTLLDMTKRRYMKDIIYTFIGPLVMSLNPFKWDIKYCKDENMKNYIARKRGLYPHAWSVADAAYRSMQDDGSNQSILVSGESGAGKTEAVKSVIKYLCSLSCSQTKSKSVRQKAMRVSEKIQESSPILEAFGNAKTINNDNSSRFGKFISIQFDNAGIIVGADVTNYLLEKSRLITQPPNERNYHIFYQMFAGGTEKTKKRLHLGAIEEYKCVMCGNAVHVESIDDLSDYKEVRKAMDIVGMSKKEQKSIFKVVAAILHLQNLVFESRPDDDDRCYIVDKKPLGIAAGLLQVPADSLEKTMTTMTRVIMNKPIESDLNADKATDTRDALSKSLYTNMFNWIVAKINSHVSDKKYSTFIGLLDIFGFEAFETNSFEQMCINYANESIQGHYNAHTFKNDIRECEREGIDTSSITFADNQPCIDLLQGRMGIMTILDDQCNFPRSNDDTLMDKLRSAFKGHPYFSVNPLKKDQFSIRHYAGTITYTVDGWLDKNRDALKEDLENLVRSSKDAVISALLPQPVSNDDSLPSRKRRLTVGGGFKNQLIDLLEMIDSTHPSWIRCIKPHKSKKPNRFNGIEVINQLRSSGVLETIRIRREGYAIRIIKKEFWSRFRIVAQRGWEIEPSDGYTAGAQLIFDKMGWTDNDIAQIGKTKIFLKTEAFSELESMRWKCIENDVRTIQRVGRGYLARKRCWELTAHIRAEKKRREEEAQRIREEQERLERLELERIERLEREERERKERKERERREREERERREREEEELKVLLEIKQATEERLRLERKVIERELEEKREKVRREQRRLHELQTLQKEREQRLAKMEREQEQAEKEESERQQKEKELQKAERKEKLKQLLEKRRQGLIEQERAKEEFARQEKTRKNFEIYAAQLLAREDIERKMTERKVRTQRKLEAKKQKQLEEMKTKRMEEEAQKQLLDRKLQEWQTEEEKRMKKKLERAQLRRVEREEKKKERQRRVLYAQKMHDLRLQELENNIEQKQTAVTRRREEMERYRQMMVQAQRERERAKQEDIEQLRKERELTDRERLLKWEWLRMREQREKKLNDELYRNIKEDAHQARLMRLEDDKNGVDNNNNNNNDDDDFDEDDLNVHLLFHSPLASPIQSGRSRSRSSPQTITKKQKLAPHGHHSIRTPPFVKQQLTRNGSNSTPSSPNFQRRSNPLVPPLPLHDHTQAKAYSPTVRNSGPLSNRSIKSIRQGSFSMYK